jgi:protein TonB
MFEQSLLENAARGGWKKALAVVISIMFQVSLLMILVVMPLIFPESVPKIAEAAKTWLLPQPPPRPIPVRVIGPRPQGASSRFRPLLEIPPIQVPTGIPDKISMTPDPASPDDPFPVSLALPGNGAAGPFQIPGLPAGGGGPPEAPPRPVRPEKEQTKGPVVIGTLDPARVSNRVQPIYPTLARQARIQGVVLLEAIIGKTGSLEKLRVLSGHPLLVQAALDAVNQWRYRPTVLDGEPVEVITTVEVHFTLGQ